MKVCNVLMSLKRICDHCIPLLKKYGAITTHNTFRTNYSSQYVLKCLGTLMGNKKVEVPDIIPKAIQDIIHAPGDEKLVQCGDENLYLLRARMSCSQGSMAYQTHCLADVWIGARVSDSCSIIPKDRVGKYAAEK